MKATLCNSYLEHYLNSLRRQQWRLLQTIPRELPVTNPVAKHISTSNEHDTPSTHNDNDNNVEDCWLSHQIRLLQSHSLFVTESTKAQLTGIFPSCLKAEISRTFAVKDTYWPQQVWSTCWQTLVLYLVHSQIALHSLNELMTYEGTIKRSATYNLKCAFGLNSKLVSCLWNMQLLHV